MLSRRYSWRLRRSANGIRAASQAAEAAQSGKDGCFIDLLTRKQYEAMRSIATGARVACKHPNPSEPPLTSSQTSEQPLRKRVLAIASGGGHWVELQRLKPAFEGLDTVYASVYPEYADEVPGHRFYSFRDVSRWDRLGFLVLAIQLLRLLLKERPTIAITTGSLPCCIALMMAKYLLGSKTIWIDSIANVEQVSSSGKLAGKFVDVWLTQWPGIAKEGGPYYWGAVL